MNLRWVYTAVHNYNQGHAQSWNKIIRCSLTKKNEHHYRTRRPLTHFNAVVITVDVWITNSGAFGVYFGRSYTFTCRNRHFWVSCGASCRSTLRRVESLNQVLSKLKPKQADVDHTLKMMRFGLWHREFSMLIYQTCTCCQWSLTVVFLFFLDISQDHGWNAESRCQHPNTDVHHLRTEEEEQT